MKLACLCCIPRWIIVRFFVCYNSAICETTLLLASRRNDITAWWWRVLFTWFPFLYVCMYFCFTAAFFFKEGVTNQLAASSHLEAIIIRCWKTRPAICHVISFSLLFSRFPLRSTPLRRVIMVMRAKVLFDDFFNGHQKLLYHSVFTSYSFSAWRPFLLLLCLL